MSLMCPSCGNSIDQDFGVITCARCAAVLFIDMEGQIQVAEESAQGAPEPVPPEPSRAPSRPVMPPRPAPYMPPPPPQPQMSPMESRASSMPSHQPSHHETPVAQSFEASNESSMMETPAEHYENPSENFNESANSSGTAEMFSEVSEFGNTDQPFGALSYSILIENIDTSSTRQKLFEALSDAKFQWDAKELIQQIEQGRLQLTQLNPAKASVLVRRLQDVPVKVSWDQKLL